MLKRFFVSASKNRSADANALAAELTECGWHRTYEWKALHNENLEQLAAFAVAEMKGVRDADVLIVLLPGGFGTHVEIGAALALGKPVIIHAPDQKTLETPYRCPFHYHPNVKLFVSPKPDVDAILAALPT
jgi:nucleoside 2-deoxyribosyltransferase